MAYTDEQKIQILIHAKEHGVMDAADKFNVDDGTIRRWNRKLRIYEQRKQSDMTDEQRIKILKHANEHGVSNASQTYGVSIPALMKWDEKLHVLNENRAKKHAPHTKYTEEEKIKILNFVKSDGITKAVQAFKVPMSLIAHWNDKYHIYEPRKKTAFTPEFKSQVVEFAQGSTILKTARHFGISKTNVRAWIAKNNTDNTL